MAVSGIDHTRITEEQPQEDRVVSDMTNLIFPVYWQLYNASEILYILSPPIILCRRDRNYLSIVSLKSIIIRSRTSRISIPVRNANNPTKIQHRCQEQFPGILLDETFPFT